MEWIHVHKPSSEDGRSQVDLLFLNSPEYKAMIVFNCDVPKQKGS